MSHNISEVYRRALVGNYQLHKFDDFMYAMLHKNDNKLYEPEEINYTITEDISRVSNIYINSEKITKDNLNNYLSNDIGTINKNTIKNLIFSGTQTAMGILSRHYMKNLNDTKNRPHYIQTNDIYIVFIEIKNDDINFNIYFIKPIEYLVNKNKKIIFNIGLSVNISNKNDYNIFHCVVGKNYDDVLEKLRVESMKFPLSKYSYNKYLTKINEILQYSNGEIETEIDIKPHYNYTDSVAIPRFQDIEVQEIENITEIYINSSKFVSNDSAEDEIKSLNKGIDADKIIYLCTEKFFNPIIHEYHNNMLYGYKNYTNIKRDKLRFNEETTIDVKISEEEVIILIINECDYGESEDNFICNVKTRIYIKNNEELNKMEIICKPSLHEIRLYE